MAAPTQESSANGEMFKRLSFKNNRLNILDDQGEVIPLDELPLLDPLLFQLSYSRAFYQLSKEVFNLREELKHIKQSVKKAKKRGKNITFEEEPPVILYTSNPFESLTETDE
jgi:hypothetical protein